MSFAEHTTVSVARSRLEIEALLTKYGATSFASGWQNGSAVLICEAQRLKADPSTMRRLRFDLPLPAIDDKRFARDGRGYSRTLAQRTQAMEAEHRRLWRALALVIKAKLESVASGIETFEEAFLANIVVPGGATFGEWAIPQIARAYNEGASMPPLLGGGSCRERGDGE